MTKKGKTVSTIVIILLVCLALSGIGVLGYTIGKKQNKGMIAEKVKAITQLKKDITDNEAKIVEIQGKLTKSENRLAKIKVDLTKAIERSKAIEKPTSIQETIDRLIAAGYHPKVRCDEKDEKDKQYTKKVLEE